jgi:hypothetical protein
VKRLHKISSDAREGLQSDRCRAQIFPMSRAAYGRRQDVLHLGGWSKTIGRYDLFKWTDINDRSALLCLVAAAVQNARPPLDLFGNLYYTIYL